MKSLMLLLTMLLIAQLCAGCSDETGVGPDTCYPDQPPELNFRSALPFHEGLAAVVPVGGSLYGFIDTSGASAIPCAYHLAGSFSEGRAEVTNTEYLSGYIDTRGTLRIPYLYAAAHPFSEGLAYVWNKDGGRFIDQTGTKVFDAAYDEVHDFKEGRAMVRSGYYPDARYGFIDRSGAIVIPRSYHDADDFHNGLAPVENAAEKWGFIDRNGVLKVPFIYDCAEKFSEGLALVGTINKEKSSEYPYVYDYGYIDTTGKVELPLRYSYAHSFSDGMAVASGQVIDRMGRIVSTSSHGAAYFVDGVGRTESWCGTNIKDVRTRYGFVSLSGERLFPDYSTSEIDISEGLIAVCIESGTNDGSPRRTRTAGFITKEGHLWKK